MDVAAYPVWDTTGALRCLLRELCKLLQAEDATWLAISKQAQLPRDIPPDLYGAIFTEMDGWTPTAAEYLKPGTDFKRMVERWLMHARKEGLDPMTRVLLGGAGECSRALNRHDAATEEEWREHWISQKFLHFYGVGERLIAITPLDETREACIVIDRPKDAPPFTARERDFLHLALTSMPYIHRRLFLERGLIHATSRLSRRERDTYLLLLTELSESEIADKMCLSTHTVHDYGRKLYKKFNVKGRIGLMALVLEG